MHMRLALLGVMACCYSPLLLAQDPVKVDSKHYTVLSENARVRILKVHYGAHEKSIMHSHPAAVAVFINDGKGKFTFPDGKTEEFSAKAGDARYHAATTHLPENTGDQPFDVIVVELKGRATKSATPPAK